MVALHRSGRETRKRHDGEEPRQTRPEVDQGHVAHLLREVREQLAHLDAVLRADPAVLVAEQLGVALDEGEALTFQIFLRAILTMELGQGGFVFEQVNL